MSQQGSDNPGSENSGERPPQRPISLRPGDASGSLPPPLKLAPLGRPGAPPPPPSSAAAGAAQRIEFQQLELKNGPGGGMTIPPRPVINRPPLDPSGVISPNWPPPSTEIEPDEVPTETLEEAEKQENPPRFLPGPELANARSRKEALKPPPLAREPLGPPPSLEDEPPARGSVEADLKASWREDKPAPTPPAQTSRPPKKAGLGKGPIVLVTLFGAVLLGLVLGPFGRPQASPTPVALTTTPEPAPSLAVADPTSEPTSEASPEASATIAPSPEASETASVVETPQAEPSVGEPVASSTPEPQVTPEISASASPVVAASATPLASETPATPVTPQISATPLAATPGVTPSPEEPPAKATSTYYSVQVYITPASVNSKVYLVNGPSRFADQGSGHVRLQPDKKGSYTLKILASGYETFTKEIKVSGEHKIAVRLQKVPEPTYEPPPPSNYDPGPAPAPAPYYEPPPYVPPAPAPYQIPAPNI